MGYKIQKIYVGTNQVRPEPDYIECDFTTSDCGFVYNSSVGSTSYGRNGSGLYINANGYHAVGWLIPSSIYSQGNVKKIELNLYGTLAGNGGGVSYLGDQRVVRSRINWLQKNMTGTETTTNLNNNTPANTRFTFTIDLENKETYISSEPGTKQTLTTTDVNNLLSYWNNGQLEICALTNQGGNTYTYISNAKFYF